MLDVFDLFLVGGIFCGFITSFLLFVQARRYQQHASQLLSLAIFPMVWYAFIYLLFKTNWILRVPDLFKLGSPLYYVMGPCSYLYVRSVILDEGKFRKWDWLHFLPAIFHFIELMPFYLTDAEAKRQTIREAGGVFTESYTKGSGLLPAHWHVLVRPFHIAAYLLLQWRLLMKATGGKTSYAINGQAFSRLRTWLFSFSGLTSFIIAGLLAQTLIRLVSVRSQTFLTANWEMQIVMIFAFVAISAYLFFRPDILYGSLKTNSYLRTEQRPHFLPATPAEVLTIVKAEDANVLVVPAENPVSEEPEDRGQTLLNEELVSDYSGKIEEQLLLHQLFRKKGLSIKQLAEELSMPVHHLSYMLNHFYKQRFNDFINLHRINYVLELFKKGESKNMKTEALASEAGFSSRSTFFAAFKKTTGLTPAEYAKQTGSSLS